MMGGLRVLLYLVRDALHRWAVRVSSPLARVMVVFFLSFCGLVFLSSYVLSVKALWQRINRSGAGLLVAAEFVNNKVHGADRCLLPPLPDEYELHVFHEALVPARVGQTIYRLVELPLEMATLVPPGAKSGVLLLPERPTAQRMPTEVEVQEYRLAAATLPEAQAGLLRRLWPSGAVFVPAGCLPMGCRSALLRKYVLELRQVDVEHVARWTAVLRQLSRLDKRNMDIISSAELLGELQEMESIQYRVRVWVALGISAITCLLLTSISSLEFRQNQYVYALLSSFGAGRPLLFLSFIGENTLLVASGFAGALGALYAALPYMTGTLFRTPELQLSLWELEADIRTFCLALGICVLVSGIPIMAAICRPIGNVLK